MHRYLCPAAGCSSIFHTVKYLCDHIGLFHDTPKHASPLICGINTCTFKSMSVGGYRKHIQRCHAEDWHSNRYRRNDDCVKLLNEPYVIGEVPTDILMETAEPEHDNSIDSTFSCYYSQLQKKLTQVILKNREMSLIPKSTMVSLVKDIRHVVQLSQLAFAQTLSQSICNRFSLSDADNILQDLIEQTENVLDDIFKTVSSAKRFKNYCYSHLNMIMPREEKLEPIFRNGKWFKQSYQYVPIMETLKQYLIHLIFLQQKDPILSVNCVKIESTTFSKDDLFVIDLDCDENPVFISITHIIEFTGLWIVCGLLTVCEMYCHFSDSFEIRCTDDYIVVNPHEIRSFTPVSQVQVQGKSHAVLSHRIL
jgi:hypothetical protein